MSQLVAITSLSFVMTLFPEEIPLLESHLPALPARNNGLIIAAHCQKGSHHDVVEAVVIGVGI